MVSMEEFGRMQEMLMEMKNEKMAVEDELKRQRNAAEASQKMYMEEAKQHSKANKIISKSKKLKEVSAIVSQHEEEMEQLRERNRGLMTNLAELGDMNEKLEKQIKSGGNGGGRGGGDSDVLLQKAELRNKQLQEQLETSTEKLASVESKLKAEIKRITNELDEERAKFAQSLAVRAASVDLSGIGEDNFSDEDCGKGTPFCAMWDSVSQVDDYF